MSFLSSSRTHQGVVDVFMRDPERYLPFTQLLAGIMSGESELSKPQREMIALHVSKINDCHYCIGSHSAILSGLGVGDAEISNAERGTADDEKTAALLSFAATLTQNPGGVVQADVDLLSDAGWSEQAVEDAIGVVSLFSFLNRLVDGFGIKGSAEVFTQSGGMIAEHGYGPVVQMMREKTA